MKRYYERTAPDSHPLLSKGLIGEAFKDVDEAAGLAKNRPDVQARLAHIKHYLRHVQLRWQFDHEKIPAKKKAAFVAAMTLGFRPLSYEYMTHWMAMSRYWVQFAAKEFKEPTWTPTGKGLPWQVDEPVARGNRSLVPRRTEILPSTDR